ncbi:MAG: ATP synthase F1 subunit delta [Ruminococcus sp.]|nr:ATP synthase F1 subunit delta [Ruminococcus sp.]
MTEICREYAEALFAIACEENEKEKYTEDLKTILEAFNENPEYMEFLLCPGIPLSERLNAVEEAFSGRFPQYIVMFMQLLCEKGRIRLFGQCVGEFIKLVDASENIAVVRVTSAVELTQEEVENIRKKLEKFLKKGVITECIIDASIMGGIIIETDGRIIDGSLRKSLREVKEVIGR